jgi:uncharacterized iron-regulated protein
MAARPVKPAGGDVPGAQPTGVSPGRAQGWPRRVRSPTLGTMIRRADRARAARLLVPMLTAAAVAGCAVPARPTPDGGLAAGGPAAPHGSAAPRRLPADPQALADAMRGVPLVLLGEMHDSAAQHALRAAALERLVAGGARPALAFEQLDRERQADVERARRERPGDADWLIAQAAGGRDGWDWSLYRPFVRLALANDLPIVAANLSRADAVRVMRDGYAAVFDAPTRASLGLDDAPAALLAAHERAVDAGHCGLMPAPMLAPMARAQIARDAALALAIAPWAGRGVVLLTGNGHARADIGVPRWLAPALRARARSIGLLEDDGPAWPADAFDRIVLTPAAPREDPCAALRARMAPRDGGQGR